MDDWEDPFLTPFRDRSNTWPRSVHVKAESSPPPAVPDIIEEPCEDQTVKAPPVPRNKQRRNVWGNKSYSELITEAIQSTVDKRMTLSQIYEWMVKNVDYFSDKHGDNSSAGWKNSIRHNLSLHDCFMKLPNEQAGKSNWWILNPNVRTGKVQRRRISVHQSPIIDLDQPDETFRRRTKSDCSSYRRPSPPASSIYLPNCSAIPCTSEFDKQELEKQEANQILDSLIEAMKLEASVSLCFKSEETTGSGTSPSTNIRMIQPETNVLVSSLTEALKIEREDNRYLEAVEPISASPPKFAEIFNDFSSPVPSYADISFKPLEAEYSVDSGVSNWVFQSDVDFSSLYQSSTLKLLKNDDSSGRRRSKSYSGRPTTLSSKYNNTFTHQQEAIRNTNMATTTPQEIDFICSFEELIQDSRGEPSLQSLEPWPTVDEWQSSTLLTSVLNS